jgi:hypothetical protein
VATDGAPGRAGVVGDGLGGVCTGCCEHVIAAKDVVAMINARPRVVEEIVNFRCLVCRDH